MRFDVGVMRGHQIYQALVALAFSAWVSHVTSIVSNDDDVNSDVVRRLRRHSLTSRRIRSINHSANGTLNGLHVNRRLPINVTKNWA